MGVMTRLCGAFVGAAAMALSTTALCATALSGMDAVKFELADLDALDGIEPFFDTSQQIEFSDLQGAGQDGPYTEAPLPAPFDKPGLIVTTGPGGYWDNLRDTQISNITLSPMTRVTFSMLAKAGAGIDYAGEFAAANITLSAFGGSDERQTDKVEVIATEPGTVQEIVRTLTVQLVNATRSAIAVGYGHAISAFALSPICRKG
jgi:hypothetical protein